MRAVRPPLLCVLAFFCREAHTRNRPPAVAICGGGLLRQSDVFGEDMLLRDPELRGRFLPRAISYLEVRYIGRDELLRIASRFSDAWSRLRRHIIFLALRRYTVIFSRTLVMRKRAVAKGLPVSDEGTGSDRPSRHDSRILTFVKKEIAGADKELGERRKNVNVVWSAPRGDRIDTILSAIGALRSEIGSMAGSMSALQSETNQQRQMLHTQQEMLLSLRDEVKSLRNS